MNIISLIWSFYDCAGWVWIEMERGSWWYFLFSANTAVMDVGESVGVVEG